MKKTLSFGFLLSSALIIAALFLQHCKKDPSADQNNTNNTSGTSSYSDINNTYGFGIFNKLKGIWDGPVSSTTSLGNFSEWIVDFRPISENQISEKSELDTANNIYMSYFIAKYNNEYRVCFRNGGSWSGQTRVSYFLADSVYESATQSFYRFAEIIKKEKRAYTEVIFRNDSLLMKSYTNKYNTLTTATIHMSWTAKLKDTTSCQAAVTNFNFPKKTLTKDFTTTFTGQAEAVYYTFSSGDPYPEAQQPYLGQATINFTYSGSYTPVSTNKVFVMITTQPLISGVTINSANMIYRSRYVVLSATHQSFVFSSMHPGTYYLYALYDADGNGAYSSGDWASTTNTTFTLPNAGTATATTQINYTIP